MTLVEVFEYIIGGHSYDQSKVSGLLTKAENVVERFVDKTLDTVNRVI